MSTGVKRLYHKHLEPPSNVCEVPDTPDGRLSGETMIRESQGAWQWAPEPEDPEPGLAPEPVEYAPVKPKAAAAKKSTTANESKEG